MRSSRKLVVDPNHTAYRAGYAAAMVHARTDAAVSNFETLCELHDLKREVAELRDILGLMVSTLRTQAETEVTDLRRRLESALARLERKPSTPLH
jgi:hypothetical protein